MAREESFFGSVCLALCGKLTWTQFIAIISIIETIVFIASLFVHGLSNADAFAPNPKTLALLGWKDARKIKNDGEVWRLFMPTFLHGSAYHIIANISA